MWIDYRNKYIERENEKYPTLNSKVFGFFLVVDKETKFGKNLCWWCEYHQAFAVYFYVHGNKSTPIVLLVPFWVYDQSPIFINNNKYYNLQNKTIFKETDVLITLVLND